MKRIFFSKAAAVLVQLSCALTLFSFASISYACDAMKPVGVVKSREHIVELYGSDNGALYTVKDLAGIVLAESISEEEILGQFPQLEYIVKGIADDASLSPPVVGDRYDMIKTKK